MINLTQIAPMELIKKLIGIAVLVALCIPQIKCSSSTKDANGSQNDFPSMTVTSVAGTEVKLKELSGKVVLILFQTDCDHCQRESAAIQQNIGAFKEYTLYFITTTSQQEIETFANSYKLSGYENVHFCKTTGPAILENFGPIDAPSLYIYSDQKLVKSFNGETPINEILKFI